MAVIVSAYTVPLGIIDSSTKQPQGINNMIYQAKDLTMGDIKEGMVFEITKETYPTWEIETIAYTVTSVNTTKTGRVNFRITTPEGDDRNWANGPLSSTTRLCK